MKLRILGDSVRLRLSQSDVRTLLETGRVEERTHFPTGATLLYAVQSSAEVDAMQATLDGTTVEVRIPVPTVKQWGESDEVSLRAEQSIDSERSLALLVEKDFKCAVPRPGEEDYDGFEHPDVTC